MSNANENPRETDFEKLANEIHHEEEKIEKLKEELNNEEKKLKHFAKELQEEEHHHKDVVLVVAVTTSGSFPKNGFEKIHGHQKVIIFLEKAAKELRIVSTLGWVAKVGGREIDQQKDYIENNLRGEVSIDYGPKHGGGGNFNE